MCVYMYARICIPIYIYKYKVLYTDFFIVYKMLDISYVILILDCIFLK